MAKESDDGINTFIVKCVNNHTLPTNLVEDKNFSAVIDYAIKHSHNLQGYQHMEPRKFITIQCNTFSDFTSKVSNIVAECQDWWEEETVSRQKFIYV